MQKWSLDIVLSIAPHCIRTLQRWPLNMRFSMTHRIAHTNSECNEWTQVTLQTKHFSNFRHTARKKRVFKRQSQESMEDTYKRLCLLSVTTNDAIVS
jgi:hypothetical protein